MECKANHSPKKRIEGAIYSQLLNNDLTVVFCVYKPLLQPFWDTQYIIIVLA